MFDWIGRKIGREAAEEVIRDRLPQILNREIPRIIEECLNKRFSKEPNLPLTEVGFAWAFHLALKRRWPGIDAKTATHWLHEYLDMPIGTDGYDWTPAAAEDLAREFVSEFGEVA